MSCFVMAFQARNRSMRMSLGLSSWGAVFFLINDWFLEAVVRLVTEVAREIE